MVDHPGRAEDGPALAAERLGQRDRHDDVVGARESRRVRGAAAAVTEDTEAVGVVDHQPRAVRPARLGEPGQRGRVAVDGEDRVGHDDRRALVGPQCLAYGVRFGVRDDLGAATGQPAAVDQRGVVAGVGDDERAVRRQRGDRGEVGRVARGEDERRLEAAELGQLAFQLVMEFRRAGDQPGAGGAAAPGPRGPRRALGDLGVAGQAQVVVARQIQQRRLRGPRTQRPYQAGAAAQLGLLVDPGERHRPSRD